MTENDFAEIFCALCGFIIGVILTCFIWGAVTCNYYRVYGEPPNFWCLYNNKPFTLIEKE